MNVAQIVALAASEGVHLWVHRGGIHAAPVGRASAELRSAVVQAKPQLLDSLPAGPPRFGMAPRHCLACSTELDGQTIIGICRPCRYERNPTACEVEREASSPPERPSLQLIVESIEPVEAPIQLTPWSRVIDPARCIDADLRHLRAVLALYSSACVDPARQDEAGDVGTEIEELIERLALCGARVLVTSVH